MAAVQSCRETQCGHYTEGKLLGPGPWKIAEITVAMTTTMIVTFHSGQRYACPPCSKLDQCNYAINKKHS